MPPRRRNPQPLQPLIAGLALLVLGACTNDRAGDPTLGTACAMRSCECTPENARYAGKPSPLQWRQNGDAYCQEGYVLRLATEKEDREEKRNRQPKNGFAAPGGFRGSFSF